MDEPDVPTGIWLRNGRLYLSREVHADRLRGCPAVALLARDSRWLLLPLMSGAGGLQVKVRNARGDRVVEAQEFFRSQGHEDSPQLRSMALHDEADAGVLQLSFC